MRQKNERNTKLVYSPRTQDRILDHRILRSLVDILSRALTENMGTMFECLHRALEDKNVGSVSADIGAEFCCVGLEPSTFCTAVQRPTT